MTGLIAIGSFILGLAVGWARRSFQFGSDQECANPEHGEKGKTWPL